MFTTRISNGILICHGRVKVTPLKCVFRETTQVVTRTTFKHRNVQGTEVIKCEPKSSCTDVKNDKRSCTCECTFLPFLSYPSRTVNYTKIPEYVITTIKFLKTKNTYFYMYLHICVRAYINRQFYDPVRCNFYDADFRNE